MDSLTGQPPDGEQQPQRPADQEQALRREQRRFQRTVARKQARHRRFLREGDKGFWFGLSSFGMVGWSIAIPTLMGIALGLWLDQRWGGGIRYTLSLLVAGLAVGMANVWRWLQSQEPVDPEGEDEASAAPAGTQRAGVREADNGS